MATNKILLVHGAWVDGSSWLPVVERLESRGFEVLAAQLPLQTLSDDVRTTLAALARLGGPAVLVGHSYGGAVISVAGAESSAVSGLVYVAAYAPRTGQAVGALNDTLPKMPLADFIRPGDGALWIERAGFESAFAHDLPPALAARLSVVQKPLGFGTLGEPLRAAAWTTLPSAYVLSSEDRVISPEAQRGFAEAMKAELTTVTAGHLSPAARPDEVAAAIAAHAARV